MSFLPELKNTMRMQEPPISRMTTTAKNDPNFSNTLGKQLTASSERDQLLRSGISHKLPSSQSSSPTSSQAANFDFKKVRHYNNLYNVNFGRHQPLVQEKYRLGPKKKIVQGQTLAPLKVFQDRSSSLPISKQILRDRQQLMLNELKEEQKSEVSQQEERSKIIDTVKPVLKKNIFHSKQQVLLSMRSIEVQIIGFGHKFLTPVYIPFAKLRQVLSAPSKQELMLNILKSLHYENGSFSYQPKNISKKISTESTFPPVMHTSIFAQGYEFQVVILLPQIEYQVSASKFFFIKPLQSTDLTEFFQLYFEDWDDVALNHLQSYRKFTEALHTLPKGVHFFQEHKEANEIKHFKNKEAMRDNLLVTKSKNQLEGCYMIGEQVALIKMSTFTVKITGLEAPYKLTHKYQLADWKMLYKFMRKKQYIDRVEKKFLKTNMTSEFSLADIKFKKKSKPKLSTFDRQKLSVIIEKDNQRYLIQLKMPHAFLIMPNGDKKQAALNEDSIKQMYKSEFQNWQEQLASTYFRIELNVQSPVKQLASITENDEDSSEDSICKLRLESREKERVEEVRQAVSVWFGA